MPKIRKSINIDGVETVYMKELSSEEMRRNAVSNGVCNGACYLFQKNICKTEREDGKCDCGYPVIEVEKVP